jgi:hypothetical protein
MPDRKGRAVQNTRQKWLRPSRSSSMSVADQHRKDFAVRGSPDRSLHRTLSAGIQVDTVSNKRSRQKDRRQPKSSAGAARASVPKRKTRVAAALSSVQGRVVSQPIAATRSHGKRHSSRNETRVGDHERVRPRGGATHPCPLCGEVTRVLRTTKVATTVQRHRQCLHCHHEYLTTERRSR